MLDLAVHSCVLSTDEAGIVWQHHHIVALIPFAMFLPAVRSQILFLLVSLSCPCLTEHGSRLHFILFLFATIRLPSMPSPPAIAFHPSTSTSSSSQLPAQTCNGTHSVSSVQPVTAQRWLAQGSNCPIFVGSSKPAGDPVRGPWPAVPDRPIGHLSIQEAGDQPSPHVRFGSWMPSITKFPCLFKRSSSYFMTPLFVSSPSLVLLFPSSYR